MRRTVDILALSLLWTTANAAVAEESAAVDGIPAGVIIYDAEPVLEAESAPDAVDEPIAIDETGVPETFSFAPPVTQSPASVRSPALPLTVEASPSGAALLDPATIDPQVDLAPGETVLQVIATPSIVKIPAPEPAYTITSFPTVPIQRTPPPPKLDPVTGRLRDTPGWTGRRDGPASIGCFPEGACAVLNTQ